MVTVVMKEMTNWHVCDQMRVMSSWSVGRRSSLGSWYQRQADAWQQGRFSEKEEGGQERVTTSEEWVLRRDWTQIRWIWRLSGGEDFVCDRKNLKVLILSQCKDLNHKIHWEHFTMRGNVPVFNQIFPGLRYLS